MLRVGDTRVGRVAPFSRAIRLALVPAVLGAATVTAAAPEGGDPAAMSGAGGGETLGDLGRACDDGYAAACGDLGRRLLDATPPDLTGARAAFDKACGPWADASCVAFARLLRDGGGGPRDTSRAAETFDAACHTGQVDACYDLARMLLDAPGLAHSPAHARHLADDACTHGHLPACRLLADLLHDQVQRVGDGDARLSRHARERLLEQSQRLGEALETACTSGDAAACADLAVRAVAAAETTSSTPARLLARACEDGAPLACYDLDVLAIVGGAGAHDPPRDPPTTRSANAESPSRPSLLRRADVARAAEAAPTDCAEGEAEACLEAALLVEHGLIPDVPFVRAEPLYRRACTGGDVRACALLDRWLRRRDDASPARPLQHH